ncbi:MAG: hypothetical protein ACTHK3_05815 [Solirubrobacterales bacterium]
MRRRFLTLALLILALAAPATRAAGAETSLLPPLPPRQLMTQVGAPVPPPRDFRSGFQVDPASSGYEVGVSTFGSAVTLVVSNQRRKSVAETLYVAKGVATPDRLQATFGQFGKVLMRFHETSKHAICFGTFRLVRHKGVYVGNLRFRGKNGYVSVHIHRAAGGILEPGGRCPRRPHRHHHHHSGGGSHIFFGSPSAFLAESRHGVDFTGLLALEFGPISEILATHEESRGKLAILRAAFAYPHKAFHVNEAATAATVSLPAPFHGTGHYRAAPDGSTTWTGDLAVNFPGAPRFPLTGPDFKTFLEAAF